MNRYIIILFLLAFSHVIYCTSLNSQSNNRETKLNILNSLSSVSATSLFEPIELYINDAGDLRAAFNKDQGEILIQITDNKNIPVYESIVNTSFERETYIPASTLPAGTYTIYFIIDDDQYWYAEFEL
ncbi:MAG: DUF3244 domain-containing protein [Bacteroides sp.]|nr:DUF3244 domain-containing protein [Bacteroides sp.]